MEFMYKIKRKYPYIYLLLKTYQPFLLIIFYFQGLIGFVHLFFKYSEKDYIFIFCIFCIIILLLSISFKLYEFYKKRKDLNSEFMKLIANNLKEDEIIENQTYKAYDSSNYSYFDPNLSQLLIKSKGK